MLSSFFSCEDKDELKDVTLSSLTEFNIEPINGGASITYVIPDDPNISYILAEYERNGEMFTEKSSAYLNELLIEGFNTQEKVTATLYTVNRKEQKSKPLTIEFTPLESPISLTNKSLKMTTAFGGINANWENPIKTELAVQLMIKEGGEFIEKELHFSTIPVEGHGFRGFADTLTTFALYFRDKWGNISDTTFLTTTPYFETEIKKPFRDIRTMIPYDNTSELNSVLNYLTIWDGKVGSRNGWVSKPGSESLCITIDLKQVAQLSRMIMWARFDGAYSNIFGHDNCRQFELYGIDKLDQSKLPPATHKSYWLHEWSVRNNVYQAQGIPADYVLPDVTFEDEWQYFGHFYINRLDLEVPRDYAAYEVLASEGHHFDFPTDVKPVRYIRFVCHEGNNHPPTNNYWGMGELSFFGDNSVPQE